MQHKHSHKTKKPKQNQNQNLNKKQTEKKKNQTDNYLQIDRKELCNWQCDALSWGEKYRIQNTKHTKCQTHGPAMM